MQEVTMVQNLQGHTAVNTPVNRAAQQLRGSAIVAGETAGDVDNKELQKAAREFEAIFVAYLLKVMRETMEEAGLTGSGMGRTVYTELFDQELARNLSNSGSFGIADLLVRRITAQENNFGDPSVAESHTLDTSTSVQPTRSDPLKSPNSLSGRHETEIPDFRMPVQAPVSSEFGMRKDPFTQELRFHRGIDIAAPEGTTVEAALGGKVVFSGYTEGFGNTVVVEHSEGYQTRYAHLGSLAVVKGDLLETEQLLGSVGSTGRSTGPHLHFEVSRYGKSINPWEALAE